MKVIITSALLILVFGSLVNDEGTDFPSLKVSADKGPLLGTRFHSLDELKSVISIEYLTNASDTMVVVEHSCYAGNVRSLLSQGINQKDFINANDGTFWDRVALALSTPYFTLHHREMLRIYCMSRRRFPTFGEGDVAFYDLAQTMACDISDKDLEVATEADLSEKGYINTFNHVVSQSFMTSLFSEELADYIADIHERYNMPELITGRFTPAQVADLNEGPVDNYVDMINNEWGQELGKQLRKKYNISASTVWTPKLLTNYMNDIKSYFSWVYQISFKPYSPDDYLMIRFSAKLNLVMFHLSELRIQI